MATRRKGAGGNKKVYGHWYAEVDGQDLEFIVMDVGPTEAKAFLALNLHNRPVKQDLVDRLAIDMTENRFRFNGDVVRFDSLDALNDAQHRLLAVVKSGVTVPMMVIKGFDPDVMDTLDQGITRTVVDILTTHGVASKNMSLLASTASILMMGDRVLMSHGKDKKQIAAHVEKELHWLDDICTWAKKLSTKSPLVEAIRYGKKARCLSPSPLAALRIHMVAAGADEGFVVDFFEKLAGERAPDSQYEFASLGTVRSWLVKTQPLTRDGGTQFPKMLGVYAVLIHSYNRIARGENIDRVRSFTEVIRFFDELPKPVM